MDANRFDALTRSLSSRRSAMGGLLGGGTLVLLGLPQPEEASAARCPKGKKACRKKCIPRARCCTNADCQTRTTGKVCRQGRCQCPPGKRLCGARCIPLASCCAAAECRPGQTCSAAGACGPTSPLVLDSADAQWAPCGTSTGLRYFETHTFAWPGGPFEATMSASNFAGWLFLYRAAEFNPAAPCPGYVEDAAATGHGTVAQLSVADLPAGHYVLVASNAYGANDPRPVAGPFTLGFGPAA